MKCPILSFVTFLSISLTHAADKGDKANPKSEFTLIFPDVGDKGDLSKLQVHYVLLEHPESRDASWIYDHCEYTGPDRELSISTSLAKWGHKGTPEGLEAFIFCPGYQSKTIYVGSLATTKELVFTLERLPPISLHGQIVPYNRPDSDDMDVEVSLSTLSMVGLPHHVMVDGGQQHFSIARVPLSADGSFSVGIPDFSRDAVLKFWNQAPWVRFHFNVVNRTTGHVVATLRPPEKYCDKNNGMGFSSAYDNPTPFSSLVLR